MNVFYTLDSIYDLAQMNNESRCAVFEGKILKSSNIHSQVSTKDWNEEKIRNIKGLLHGLYLVEMT